MPRTLGDAAASIGNLRAQLPRVTRTALTRALQTGRSSQRNALAAYAGADRRLSRARGRLDADVTVTGSGGSLSATGPVGLVESRVRAHVIEPDRARALGGSTLRHPVAQVRHPGLSARRVWSRGMTRTVPQVERVWHDETSRGMETAYRKG